MSAVSTIRTAPVRLAVRLQAARSEAGGDEGMSTAEYAVGTVAACGFGGVLYKVITSPQVLTLLRGVIARALKVTF